MSTIERIRWGEGSPRIQKVFEQFFADRGNVPNLFRVMGRRPEILTTFNQHFGQVMSKGLLEPRLKELLAVRVSRLNHCEY